MGSCEAAWSIFAFPTTERFPSVLHLVLNEVGGQMVYYGEGQAAARLKSASKTTLTELVAYNAAATVDDANGDADVRKVFCIKTSPRTSRATRRARSRNLGSGELRNPRWTAYTLRTLATARGSTSAYSSVTCPGPSPSAPCAHSRTAPLPKRSRKRAAREVFWRTTWSGTAA